ncbi:MAG: lipopolysaccharide heptosyltransferase II [Planctomycetota bacterium]|jgi:lipopolysaccharide heptosyltransferase II
MQRGLVSMSKLPRKILIIRLGAIGDVTNALIVATAIKAEDATIEIGWVAHGLVLPLLEGHPSVDRVHHWQRGGGFSEVRRLMRELREAGYELVIDLQRIFKSGLLASISGAPRVLGFDRDRCKEFAWFFSNEKIAKGDRHAHMVDQYMEFVRYLQLEQAEPELLLPSEDAAEEWAQQIVDELGAAPILINLGATKPANRWVPGRFGELAVQAAERFERPVCLIGGPDDRALFQSDLKQIEGARSVRDLVGSTSLPELWALERRAALFVGLDTGPMHLAVAVGLPCVILFGAADHRRTGPYGDRNRIIRLDLACSPCNKRECPLPRHDCMEDIEIEQVLSAMSDQLAMTLPESR